VKFDAAPRDHSAILARRCPGWIAATWAWQAGLAMVVAWPAASIAGEAFGRDPRGDGPLWDPGGLPLLVFLSRDANAVRGILNLAAIVFVGAAVAGLLPAAALMIAMSDAANRRRRRSISRVCARAVRAFPALAILLVVVTLVESSAAGGAWVAVKLIDVWAHDAWGEARAEAIEMAVCLAALVPLAAVLGVVHDLARASVVRYRVGAARALFLGARAFRLTPWSLSWAWAWRAGLAWGVLLPAAALADAMGSRSGETFVLLACLHESTIGVRAALRASWMARALGRVNEPLDQAGRGPRYT
jgi:hypothetical protein